VKRVLEACRPQRIGHGIRAVEDPELLDELVRRRLPLEVSPTSNVRLGNADSYDAHPLATLYSRGVPLSINTDDPAFFGTTLVEEYLHAARMLDLEPQGVAGLARAAVGHSFLPATAQAEIESEIDREAARALEALGE